MSHFVIFHLDPLPPCHSLENDKLWGWRGLDFIFPPEEKSHKNQSQDSWKVVYIYAQWHNVKFGRFEIKVNKYIFGDVTSLFSASPPHVTLSQICGLPTSPTRVELSMVEQVETYHRGLDSPVFSRTHPMRPLSHTMLSNFQNSFSLYEFIIMPSKNVREKIYFVLVNRGFNERVFPTQY